jgi:cell division protein FtsI/penicillin-binding protein 2
MVGRVRLVAIALTLLALCIIGRLYYVQVMAHEYYVDRASKQYVHTVQDLYRRGSVFFYYQRL